MTYPEFEKLVLSKKNIFLSGAGGTGKTHHIKKLVENHPDIVIAVTATTGIAALNIDGQTIHRFASMGICSDPSQIKHVTKGYKYRNEQKYVIAETKLLVIDEMSMFSPGQIELLDLILKHARRSDKPFGGLQVIIVADFMQLSPIVKGATPELMYCFQSPVWKELDLTNVYLTKVYRQEDKEFANMLRFVRAGIITKTVDEYFKECEKTEFPEGVDPIFIMSTNAEVYGYNRYKMNLLETELISCKASLSGFDEKAKERLLKDCKAPMNLELKEGCQIMLLVNDPDDEYVNGTTGIFRGTEKANVVVRVGGERIVRKADHLRVEREDGSSFLVKKHDFKIEKKSINYNGDLVTTTLASLVQFPAMVAYAVTSHKAQGASIANLVVNMSSIFTMHQAYVMLSRATKKSGLKIVNWDASKIYVDSRCFNFYKKIAEEQKNEEMQK